jgi:hypothetical protein
VESLWFFPMQKSLCSDDIMALCSLPGRGLYDSAIRSIIYRLGRAYCSNSTKASSCSVSRKNSPAKKSTASSGQNPT